MVAPLKKFLLVAAVAILFALYAFQQRPQSIAVDPKTLAALQAPSTVRPLAPTLTPTPASDTPTSITTPEIRSTPGTIRPTGTSLPASATATRVPPSPTVPPTATASGMYADGSYTGIEADAHWGYVTVVGTVSNGQLVDVQFLEFPNHRNRSQEINNWAMPELIQEAIQAQSAEVDLVSGATDTSRAFIQSLESALQQAQP